LDERALRKIVMQVIGRESVLDDCAVIPCGDTFLVASTDMLHESTDFPEGITDRQIGWMSVAVTLSDIAAMGADPWDILLAVGLDKASRLLDILRGAKECCDTFGTRFSGGDLDHHRELTLVSSGLGAARNPVRRSGSRPGDLIGIVGIPGRAQAALDGYHQYDKVLFEPWPRVREGRILARSGVTSMMDVSDGLIVSLYDLLEANPCGYEIETGRLPLIGGLPVELSRHYALTGGGDYLLLFTFPPGSPPPDEVDFTIIGKVILDQAVRVDGEIVEIEGYQHDWS
jgi:thiamine-monophosphate kinase